jgi:hypothetical protein
LCLRDRVALDEDIAQAIAPIHDGGVGDATDSADR